MRRQPEQSPCGGLPTWTSPVCCMITARRTYMHVACALTYQPHLCCIALTGSQSACTFTLPAQHLI